METINLLNTVSKTVKPFKLEQAAGTQQTQQAASSALSFGSEAGKKLPQGELETNAAESKAIEKKVSELNEFVQSVQRGIQFSVQEETGRSIITVTDKESGEKIRSFPSDEFLALAEFIAESKANTKDALRGLVFNQSA